MKLDGDLLPSASGEANLGIQGPDPDAYTPVPFGLLHVNSGVFHDSLGGEAVLFLQNDELKTKVKGKPEQTVGGITTINSQDGPTITIVGVNGVVITQPSADEILIDTASISGVGGGGPSFKSITVEAPTNSEDITFFYTDADLEITKMIAGVAGTIDASGVWTLRHDPDRSAAGNEVVTGGTVTTNRTTGQEITVFNDATIPASSFVWLETTAVSGVATDSLYITVFF